MPASGDSYTVTATSKSNNTFMIAKSAAGIITRTCNGSGGGCPTDGGSW